VEPGLFTEYSGEAAATASAGRMLQPWTPAIGETGALTPACLRGIQIAVRWRDPALSPQTSEAN
jgi:hypothetical protein